MLKLLSELSKYAGLVGCFGVLVLLLLCAPRAHATSGQKTITISPFLSDVQIQPGEVSKDVTITITNTTMAQQEFAVSAVDFGSLGDTGGLAFAGGNADTFTKKYGLVQWLHLPTDHLNLEAGKSTQLTATIANDDTLGPGGHYAAIILTVATKGTDDTDAVTVQQKISALIFATKQGGEVYDMHLSNLTHDSALLHLPDVYTLTFENRGNVHLVPRGTLRLLDPTKHVVSTGVINEASAYVLPETSREVAVQPQGGGVSGWLPGTYTVQVDYRYDGLPTFARKTYSFVYFNPIGIVAVLAGLVLLVYISVRQLRRHGFSVRQLTGCK